MGFTRRQGQILDWAARGHSDKEIARELGVSVHTVRSHLQRLYKSQHLANRSEAVAAFVAGEAHSEPVARFPRRLALIGGAVAGATLALSTVAVWPLAQSTLARLRPVAAATPSLEDGVAPLPIPASAAPAPARAETPTPRSAAQPAAARSPSPAVAPAVPPSSAGQQPAPAPVAPIQLISATGQLSLINQERAAAGLPALAWDQCLAGVAGAQARRLAQQGYISSADGTDADTGCRLGLTPPREELAYWPGASDSQMNTVLAANPVDRAQLLGPFHYMGAAWAVGPTGIAFLAIELS